MRRETTDAQEIGARRETLDALVARLETRDIRRVSSLSSCNLVSRLTSHAPAPWPKVRLGDVGKVVTGLTPPTKHSEYFGVDYLFVTPSDLEFDSRFINKTERGISKIGHLAFQSRFVPPMTTMYTCIGSTIGKIGLSHDCVLTNQQINSIVPHKDNDGMFIFYMMRYLTKNIRMRDAGCAVPIINKGDFESFQIPLPPLPVQRRIADVLSAYDDLIENNRRRIAILEETARLAYRKWFGGSGAKGGMRHETIDASEVRRETRDVRRVSSLPSHASVSRLTSHAQLRTVTLGEVVDVLYGKDHKKIPDGTIPIFGSGGVMRHGSNAIFDRPSVLIPRKGTISNVMYVDEPFWTVDTMFYTRMKIPYMEKIFYYQMCDLNLAAMSTGAAVPSMTTAILNSLQIVVPPENERKRFDESVEPLFGQMRLLKKQSAALAAARDMLLPRLMNNKLRKDA